MTGGTHGGATPKKRQRLSTTTATGTVPKSISAVDSTPKFNDPATSDVILTLHPDPSIPAVDLPDSISAVDLHLHSHILRRSNYFSTLLSDRWQIKNKDTNNKTLHLSLTIPPYDKSIHTYTTLLQLLYTTDFAATINSVSLSLSLLPAALELLFEDCVTFCVRFLEAVPWTEEEENKIINLIPFLNERESSELLARVCDKCSCEEMLRGLIQTAIYNHTNMAFAKAFVAKLLRDFSSRESAKRVLDEAFTGSLKVVREAMEEYSSPDFRSDHIEIEALQRLNLHTALTNGRHLLWLVERMIELRVADVAVEEWSELEGLTTDLQRAFRDDAWRNIVPGLPAVVLRCTCKLANAVAAGVVLPCRQVRMKLVKDWLPVLIVCKENVSPMVPGHKTLYPDLEETFLKIISTLPMSDAQELLQQCLSFSTRNADDCPHLITAFNIWFRRANRHLDAENRDS